MITMISALTFSLRCSAILKNHQSDVITLYHVYKYYIILYFENK